MSSKSKENRKRIKLKATIKGKKSKNTVVRERLKTLRKRQYLKKPKLFTENTKKTKLSKHAIINKKKMINEKIMKQQEQIHIKGNTKDKLKKRIVLKKKNNKKDILLKRISKKNKVKVNKLKNQDKIKEKVNLIDKKSDLYKNKSVNKDISFKSNKVKKNNNNINSNIIQNVSKESVKKSNNKDLFDNELIKRLNHISPMNKYLCFYCKKDVTNKISFITSTLKDLCIDCLVQNKCNEDYHVKDNINSFPKYNSEWSLLKEITLLNCVEKFGLDNWTEVANFIKFKPKLPCETHFYSYYLKNGNEFNETDCILRKNPEKPTIDKSKNKENQDSEEKMRLKLVSKQGIIPDICASKEMNRSRSLVKKRDKGSKDSGFSCEEVVGYWPKRQEFDLEHCNEAEIEIAELEFNESDTEEDKNMKLKILEIYNRRLDEREERKK